MIARGNAAFALAERIEAEDDEAIASHGDAEGLEIGQHLALGPPMAVVEQDGGRGRVKVFGKIEVRRHMLAGERFEDDLLDAISLSLDRACSSGMHSGRPRHLANA